MSITASMFWTQPYADVLLPLAFKLMSITWSPVGTDHWAAKKYFKMIGIFLTEKQFYSTLINHRAYEIVLNFVLFELL